MDPKQLYKSKAKLVLFLWGSIITIGLVFLANSNASTRSALQKLQKQESQTSTVKNSLEVEVEALSKQVEEYGAEIEVLGKVMFYMSKLSDKDFIGSYGHGYTWYAAAEELGKIGRPAIPYLVENLQSKNGYERTVTFYALMLATQNENVKELTKGDYINFQTALEFDESQHAEMKRKVDSWWEKYKNYWESQN